MIHASHVRLVVEIVSPESTDRDRNLKALEYADAGIPHFWRIEDEDGIATVHVYELDIVTSRYVPTGIHRKRLNLAVPFEMTIDLADMRA